MSTRKENREDPRDDKKMDVQKSFVNSEGIATIKCPKCGVIKNLPAAEFRGRQHTLKVRCKCDYAWSILLDFRRHYRKKAELAGTYTLIPPASGSGGVTVLNISRSGVGFRVKGMHSIMIGQKARLRFTLDNKKQTPIDKNVIIKAVNAGYIGCEFIEDRAFDKDLGFYLQP
jgi:hypothetical protein